MSSDTSRSESEQQVRDGRLYIPPRLFRIVVTNVTIKNKEITMGTNVFLE